MIRNREERGMGHKRFQESVLILHTSNVLAPDDSETTVHKVWLLQGTCKAEWLKNLHLEIRHLGSEHIASVWSWANHLYSWSLILLLCKMGAIMAILYGVGVRID